MKIAVWHNLNSGGGKRALYDHVRGLIERGHTVQAWCPSTVDQTYLSLSTLCDEHVLPLSLPRPLPWLRRGRSFVAWQQTSQKLSAMDDHCRECASQINAGGFDILFANSCVLFRVTSIAKHVQVPSVLYLQEPFRWLYEALPDSPWALPRANRDVQPVERWLRLAADLIRVHSLRRQVREEIESAAAFNTILVNSLYSRESILRAYGLESKVCYLGVDLNRFAPTDEAIEPFVLGVGALSYEKGPDRAIRALAAVERCKRPELIWVSNFPRPEYERELQTLAARCGVRLTVKVRVSDSELVSLLSRATMLLDTPRLEPFGLAPLEANACGTPVVAIAEGGVRESIQHEQNGLLVNGDAPKELARAIERLIDEPAFAAELRARCVCYVRDKWSMKGAIDRLETALMSLTDGSSARRSASGAKGAGPIDDETFPIQSLNGPCSQISREESTPNGVDSLPKAATELIRSGD
jgi:glycosyltransferase involved in cell wall biosynthesis